MATTCTTGTGYIHTDTTVITMSTTIDTALVVAVPSNTTSTRLDNLKPGEVLVVRYSDIARPVRQDFATIVKDEAYLKKGKPPREQDYGERDRRERLRLQRREMMRKNTTAHAKENGNELRM